MTKNIVAIIEKEGIERTGHLSLTSCGLVELPKELLDCVWSILSTCQNNKINRCPYFFTLKFISKFEDYQTKNTAPSP